MVVFIDTTVIYSDRRLSRLHSTALVRYLAAIDGCLYVPEIVVDEAVNLYREKVEDQVRALGGHARELEGLLGRQLHEGEQQSAVDALAESQEYRRQLLSQMEATGALTAPYPEVSHAQLVTAALARRKPFRQDGRGYRDALIWCSVLDAARDEDDVVFISSNGNDFPPSEDGPLDEGLEAWVKERDLPAGRIHIFSSLRGFFDRRLAQVPLEQIDAQLIAGSKHQRLDVAALLRDWADQIRAGVNAELEGYSQEGFEQPSLSWDLEAPDGERISVREIDASTLLVDLSLRFDEVLLDYFVFRSDTWAEDHVSLTEWNEWYYQAQNYVGLLVELSVTFDRDKQQVDSVEVDGVQVTSERPGTG